jgi:hypothetical protein
MADHSFPNFLHLKDKLGEEFYNIALTSLDYVKSDPNVSIVKIRLLAELITNYLFDLENLKLHDYMTQEIKINILKEKQIIPVELAEVLHEIRITGNKAVHEGYASSIKARSLLLYINEYSEWFIHNYEGRLKSVELENEPYLFPIKIDGKVGFINKAGKVILECQYLDTKGFSGGYAPVKVGDQWAVIDVKGRMVVPPRFQKMSKYTEGLSVVMRNDKYYFVDYLGKSAFNREFSYNPSPFRDGVAVIDEDSVQQIIDINGNVLYEDDSEGYIASSFGDNGLNYFFYNEKYGFINKFGKQVISNEFEFASEFSEGLAYVVNENGTYGFINTIGEYVIPSLYADEIGDFHEGLAAVLINGKYGFIDKTGNLVIKNNFEGVCPEGFSEGLIKFSENRKVGFINKNGDIIVPPIYDDATPFNNGLSMVVIAGKAGYIDKEGNAKYKFTSEFIDVSNNFLDSPREDDYIENQVLTEKVKGFIYHYVATSLKAEIEYILTTTTRNLYIVVTKDMKRLEINTDGSKLL